MRYALKSRTTTNANIYSVLSFETGPLEINVCMYNNPNTFYGQQLNSLKVNLCLFLFVSLLRSLLIAH